MPVQGDKNRQKPRRSARRRAISPPRLHTLQDLLRAIRLHEPQDTHLLAMLGATAAHISILAGEPPERIDMRRLLDIKPALQAHLRKKGFKRNSIRSYTTYLGTLIKKAKELGWAECSPELVSAWEPIRQALASIKGCSRIVRFAVLRGKGPADFTEADLAQYGEAVVKEGRTLRYVGRVKCLFRKRVFNVGFGVELPGLAPPNTARIYRLPFSKFPVSLRTEVQALLSWKSAKFSAGRASGKIRPVTAKLLRELMCRLAGFRVNIKGTTLSSLADLLSEEAVIAYVGWAINERGLSCGGLRVEVGRIGALKSYPPFASQDFSWVAKLLERLPRTSDEELRQKKERKWVAYDVLARIPEQIREEADSIPGLDEKRKALMMRNALIMAWLTTLPWRQRNLRECRVLPFADGGNLFQEEIPPHSTMSKPQWVVEALRENPRQKFWQFYFRGPETKTGCVVRAILPDQLIPILEEYLNHHRKILLGRRRDPLTLLLTMNGNPLTAIAFEDAVAATTLKYASRAVNPHLMRDIFTVQWLEEHPEDFLTASKNLWHRNIQTTLQIYGANFDESHAARRVEEWLKRRKK